eukprot:TRINITY_DN982_c0_g1_i1.p1 TRINITY_DN982_c0_g1~~TRINITY_DN982_c0_g1_i1.p1  ORF type:complete len:376 (-),score=126.48 TRINITY_DN982_c0_g1_i1:53-1180(-)
MSKRMGLAAITMMMMMVVMIAAKKQTAWNQLDGYTFDMFLAEFNKQYDDSFEYKMREEIFNSNLELILKHNRNQHHTYKMGVNHMSDFTPSEFKKLRGYKRTSPRQETNLNSIPFNVLNVEDLPAAVDWRTQGVVTPVKDQGQCGSCWSFATAETVESHYAIAMGPLSILSEQQILDCTPNPQHCGGTGGCDGGTAELAYAQIMSMGGLSSEWQYPYLSGYGQNYACHFNATETVPVAVVRDFVVLPSNQYNAVLTAVATVGPLAISADAAAWQHYESGVFSGCDTTTTDIDHAIQLVGYGTDATTGEDFWIVRNSWTPLWGEDGYIRISRSAQTYCGVDTTPQDGSGCDGGPANVTVCGPCGLLYDTSYPIVVV